MKKISCFFICFFAMFTTNASQLISAVPSISAINQLTIATVEKKIKAPAHAKIKIIPQALDSRIKRPVCSSPLTVELASKREIKRNNTVKVSCHTPELDYPWQVFITVRVEILYPVVVARETLGPGDLISASNVTIDYVDQTELRGQQFSQTSELVGAKLKRRVAAKSPIFNNHLCLVCKGDIVAITARSQNIKIKTTGEAMQDASMGSMVRVKNTRSNNIVDAKVIGVGRVEVNM